MNQVVCFQDQDQGITGCPLPGERDESRLWVHARVGQIINTALRAALAILLKKVAVELISQGFITVFLWSSKNSPFDTTLRSPKSLAQGGCLRSDNNRAAWRDSSATLAAPWHQGTHIPNKATVRRRLFLLCNVDMTKSAFAPSVCHTCQYSDPEIKFFPLLLLLPSPKSLLIVRLMQHQPPQLKVQGSV